MTEQQIFNACAYHMLAHGGAPRDLSLKPEYNRRHRALVADMEQIHCSTPPAQWSAALIVLARANKLEPAL